MKEIRIKEGWLVCAKCGKKLAKITEKGIEIKCRDSRCAEKNIIDLSLFSRIKQVKEK